MQYGLSLPTGGECGDPRFLLELVELGERSGWEGLFLEDYLDYQAQGTPTVETWTILAAVALRTERMRIGSSVTPLTRRRPWTVAQAAVTVDRLSGGRVILGVGSGDPNEPGFAKLGERRSGRVLDEALEIVAGLWSGEPFTFHGEHFHVDSMTLLPPPVQRPRIPIVIGGGYPNPRPLERAARWDGSMLYKEGGGQLTPDDVADLRTRLGPDKLLMVGGQSRADDWDAEREHIDRIRDAGADWWCEWIRPADRDTMRAAVARGPLRAD